MKKIKPLPMRDLLYHASICAAVTALMLLGVYSSPDLFAEPGNETALSEVEALAAAMRAIPDASKIQAIIADLQAIGEEIRATQAEVQNDAAVADAKKGDRIRELLKKRLKSRLAANPITANRVFSGSQLKGLKDLSARYSEKAKAFTPVVK